MIGHRSVHLYNELFFSCYRTYQHIPCDPMELLDEVNRKQAGDRRLIVVGVFMSNAFRPCGVE